MRYLKALVLGTLFGIILIKSEVSSWFRIQEMFQFDAFHMYGVIGSAIFVGMISLFIIKKMKIKDKDGETVTTAKGPLMPTSRIVGGILFGLGWALTGACPGPMYALIGNGFTMVLIALFGALLGTAIYGMIKHKLPH